MMSKGREERQFGKKKKADQRQPFQIDRDRLLYSHSFRRLAQVTQVVSANEGRLFHNRLTHSLKVAQFARRTAEKILKETSPELLAKGGGLDPDVVEAAALAHDLGHPPFGHVAEYELNRIAREAKLSDGFEGNAQTFRILTLLEPNRTEYPGLDLTRATLNATIKYPWICYRTEKESAEEEDSKFKKRRKKYSVYDLDFPAFEFAREHFEDAEVEQQTLEASIMEFADDVTYSVHDLEDFYLAGLIPLDVLVGNSYEFQKLFVTWLNSLKVEDHKKLINAEDHGNILYNFLDRLYSSEYAPGSVEQLSYVKQVTSGLIQRYIKSVSVVIEDEKRLSLKRSEQCHIELEFLQFIVRKYVILNPRLATQQAGQKRIIRELFDIYNSALRDEQLNIIPARFLRMGSLNKLLEEGDSESQRVRLAVDIVASFSEPEAVLMYRRLTGVDQGSVMDYIS
jgi:dGTPase